MNCETCEGNQRVPDKGIYTKICPDCKGTGKAPTCPHCESTDLVSRLAGDECYEVCNMCEKERGN